MEEIVKAKLNTQKLVRVGRGGGGCINEGQSYVTDDDSRIYVKYNGKPGARRMFDGEAASLEAIFKTETILVPKPIAVADHKTGALLVMEHLDLNHGSSTAVKMGRQLARLHLHNSQTLESLTKNRVGSRPDPVARFGFDRTTCCGFLPLDNAWNEDWVRFYCEQRLEPQMNMDAVKGDREAHELWGKLQRKVPDMFKDVKPIPALVHGDLWSGNFGETKDSSGTKVPVIFDPASFYGHHEFEFGIVSMFGGFSSEFYSAYHAVIPKAPGFDRRLQLYELFHNLNHWNHFGSGYRGSSLAIMRRLIS